MREVEGGLPARLVFASEQHHASKRRELLLCCVQCVSTVLVCVWLDVDARRDARVASERRSREVRGAQGMAHTRQVGTWEQEKAALLRTPAGIALAVPP